MKCLQRVSDWWLARHDNRLSLPVRHTHVTPGSTSSFVTPGRRVNGGHCAGRHRAVVDEPMMVVKITLTWLDAPLPASLSCSTYSHVSAVHRRYTAHNMMTLTHTQSCSCSADEVNFLLTTWLCAAGSLLSTGRERGTKANIALSRFEKN